MKELTKHQKEYIAMNLRAFEYNFGPTRIMRAVPGPGFYVFCPADNSETGTHYAYSLDYLDGWLFGAVMAANGCMQKVSDDK